MVDTNAYKWRNARTSTSTRNAHDFCRLFITGYPSLTVDELIAAVRRLKIKSSPTLDATVYKIAFFEYYFYLRNRGGNMLPLEWNQEGERFIMSKIAEADARSSAQIPFADARELMSHETIFCVRTIRKVNTQKQGWKWFLTLQLDIEDAQEFDHTEGQVIVSFPSFPGSKMDRMLTILQNDTPAHKGVFVQTGVSKKGYPIIELKESELDYCPCAEYDSESVVVSDGESTLDENGEEAPF